MFALYVHWLKSEPLLAAAIQFAILGTLGDRIAARLRGGNWQTDKMEVLCKLPTWAILGISVKLAFLGGSGATKSLIEHGYFPTFGLFVFFFAFYKSFLVNAFFGPFMMIGHRLSDDYLARCRFSPASILRGLPKARLWAGLEAINWKSLKSSISLLTIFWVPAHTLTFLLPEHFQITMAALWAIVLGLMLGYFNREEKKQPAGQRLEEKATQS
ncbi:MAG TPA: hypothetical protein DD435_15215 [Cyanobacteria bacterium UBA8530]|nr:hypothetical protein [Cyanobacteria bacterium UBA8530]